MPAASRAIYARSIKGDLCSQHQGRSMPAASRAIYARSIASFFASDEELFFASDEEYSYERCKDWIPLDHIQIACISAYQ